MSDYISREAAIEKIRVAACCAECTYCSDFCGVYDGIRLIKSLPTADVEPVRHVHRKVWGIDEYYGEWLRCPNCGYEDNAANATYCGGCGAKIDLEGNDEN